MGDRPSCVDPAVGPLWTERRPDGRRLLLRPLVINIEGHGKTTVPAGFITDFSSFPWGTRWVTRWSKADIAGVVHDWLYAEGSIGKEKADQIWEEVALSGVHSVNGLQAWLGRRGLAWFGGHAWKKHRDKACNPASPEKPQRSQENDSELEHFADSLVQQRQTQGLKTEDVAKRMSALPGVIRQFEEKDDRENAHTDFRLVMLLRYAAAIGSRIRVSEALSTPSLNDSPDSRT